MSAKAHWSSLLLAVSVFATLVACERTQRAQKPAACKVEGAAVQPYLPKVGDRIVGSGRTPNWGFRVPRFGSVIEVRERCYSNGYGVLVIVDRWDLLEDRNVPDSELDVQGWLRDLMSQGYNPRTENRSLTFRVVWNHATSPTSLKYYVLVYRTGYDPSGDEYFSTGIEQLQRYRDDYTSFNSKDVLEDLW